MTQTTGLFGYTSQVGPETEATRIGRIWLLRCICDGRGARFFKTETDCCNAGCMLAGFKGVNDRFGASMPFGWYDRRNVFMARSIVALSSGSRTPLFLLGNCLSEVVDDMRLKIKSSWIRIDTYAPSGEVVAAVNRNDSAYGITQLPTNCVGQCKMIGSA